MTREPSSKLQTDSSHEGFQAIKAELQELAGLKSQPRVISDTIHLFNRLAAVAHEVEPLAAEVLVEQLVEIQDRVLAVLQGQRTEEKAGRRAELRGNNERSATEKFGHGRTNRAAKAAASMRTVEHRMAA